MNAVILFRLSSPESKELEKQIQHEKEGQQPEGTNAPFTPSETRS